MLSTSPLTSVVMPAYKPAYIAQALDSVLAQTYPSLELVICDDSPDGQIEALVEERRARAPFPIRYYRNVERLGELASKVRGIGLAQGHYVKFLHDDDVLEPACIAALVQAMQAEPRAVMASSRRLRIDAQGEPLPDIMATGYPFAGDVLIDGPGLVSFLGDHTINFIGEPSCVLARREDLLALGHELMSLDGQVIHWVGDLAMYVQLLQHGCLAMLAQPLVRFRVTADQFSQIGRDQPGIGEQGHQDLRNAIRTLGWYRASGDNRRVGVASLEPGKARVFRPVDLLVALLQSGGAPGNLAPAPWLAARRLDQVQLGLLRARLADCGGGPGVAVLVLDADDDPQAVADTLASVEMQALGWAPQLHRIDPTTGPAVEAINQAMAGLQADWVLLIRAGATFTPSGLAMLAAQLCALPDACLALYADEVLRLAQDQMALALRPDFNLDLLLSSPDTMSRHWVFRRAPLLAVGGFNPAVPGAFELAYQLDLIQREGLACVAHLAEPLVLAPPAPPGHPDQVRAIAAHLQARGYEGATVQPLDTTPAYAIDYGHAGQASVSIMVLLDDRLPQIQRCLESILSTTDFPLYEVLLLDAGLGGAEQRAWLEGIAGLGSQQIRVIPVDPQSGEAMQRNQAAAQARGEFLLWLGPGAAVIQRGWLGAMVNHARRPEVGAVGARLLTPAGAVHQAGLVLGLGGPAGRPFRDSAFDEPGYMQRLQLDQDVSAVGRNSLMVERTLFLEAGGFDEDPMLAPWMDVDLCLRLRQAGYLAVWTPRAQLVMDEVDPPPTAAAQDDAIYARWLPVLARDPAYNPGFSLEAGHDFRLADPHLCWRPLQSWRPLPTVLALPADLEGCGHYRVIQPMRALREAGLVDGAPFIGHMQVCDIERYDPDVIVLQRQVGEQRLEAMRRMQAFSRAFKVYELDDYLPNLPLKNAHRADMPRDILRTIRRGLGFVDRFVVSTPALAEAFAGLHADIRVVQNRLPPRWWGTLPARSARPPGRLPRVGWAGGASHAGDLALITDLVRELAGEVEWVFMGMRPPGMERIAHEFHQGVPIDRYPAALAALELDLALAPVEENLFNDCKSNLRLLEYGACGYPVIASNVRCYQGDLPVTLVRNRHRDWLSAIREQLADRDASTLAGATLQQAVHSEWMLEGRHLAGWRDAWLPD